MLQILLCKHWALLGNLNAESISELNHVTSFAFSSKGKADAKTSTPMTSPDQLVTNAQ